MQLIARFFIISAILFSLFIAGTAYAATPVVTSPVANSAFTGASQTFRWDAQGNAVTNWTLFLGTGKGKYDYYKSATLRKTVKSLAVFGLPTNGHKVYLRLRYKLNGVWGYQDSSYFVAGTNHSPTISRTPLPRVNVGSSYVFTPLAADVDGETNIFRITNKPAWASFNTTTGRLSGAPTVADAGTTNNIVIGVSDERGSVTSLPAFSITVNQLPGITGTPSASATVGSLYSFTPVANDPDGNALVFSVVNKPVWAKFSGTTGRLWGTPTASDIGTASNISIKANDKQGGIVSLPAFNIDVVSANRLINLARQFGVASQGRDYDSASAAALAIDGNTGTFNHTSCDATNNWWQVKLPKPTRISSIVVTSRNTWTSRIKDAGVYVTNAPYGGTLSDADKVATLVDTAAAQTTTFNSAKSGVYVIVKAAGSNCLHMAEVEVYGQAPAAPVFAQTAYTFNLSEKAAQGTLVGTANAVDYQLNALTYTLQGTVPFTVDGQGNISLNGALNHNLVRSYRFTVTASDGTHTVSVPVSVNLGKGTGVFLQRWEGISGSSISSLLASSHYHNDAPDYTAALGSFTVPDTGKSNFGQRLTGAIKPIQTGKYQFAIIGDDNTQLRLSSNAVLDGAPIIAHQDSWGAYQDWASAGVSNWVTLEAGKVYTVEALHKEGSGSDHVSVGWKREGDSSFATIPPGVLYQDALSAGAVEPAFLAHSTRYLLKWTTAAGTRIAQIRAIDPQGDTLTYKLTGSNLFAVDMQGNISVKGTLQAGTIYALTLRVTDGVYSISTGITVNTTSGMAVLDAIHTGNASNVTADELVDAGIAQAQAQTDNCKATLSLLYPNGLEATTFPVRSAYFNSSSARNIPFHVGINAGATHVYSWIGEKDSGTRYGVLGTNVFTFANVKTDMKDSTLNLFKWLLKQPGSTDILNQKLTILVTGSGERTALADWFSSNGLSSQWTIASDTKLLDTGAFDLYLGDITRSLTEMQKAFALDKPVLVFNNWYQPADATLAEFELTWSWYGQGTIGNLSSTQGQCDKSSATGVIQTTLTSLRNGLPDFIYEASDCPNNVGTVSCDLTKVTDAAGNSADALFNQGASAVRSQLLALDAKGVSVFSLNDSENLIKLAVLLGDKYRESAQFPMDKVATDDSTFYRALFADYAVHYATAGNPYQPDMGDFTDAQSALNAATAKTATRTYTPTVFDEWTSTGLYAPPGKTITVRRMDNGSSVVKVRFNYLRESTRLWNDNQYSRPRYISSPAMTLEAGKTYTFSTPYGGPVYLGWTGVGSGAAPFTVELANVLDNPLLQAFDDVSIQTFLNEVQQTDSDWIDLKTPYAEIHTLKSNMLTAFASQDGDGSNGYTTQDVKDYIDDLNNYLIAGNYAYAGFTGTGLPTLDAEVQAFCNSSGLNSVNYGGSTKNLCTDATINAKPKIQHINSDINALCGGLCSGNPFDSYAPIDPLGWGENHEMGHNLQPARLKIYAGRSTEVSNNIFPLHTQWKWTVNQGLSKHPDQTRPANQAAFTILQAAIKAGTAANASHPLWSGTGTYDNAFERLSFYMQLAYTQQSWDIYTKMYLMERIFADAIKDTTDAKWDAVKGTLGFSNYSRSDASNLSTNDFVYIAASKIAGKDYSNYFAAWGIDASAGAKAQVQANGMTGQIPAVFYYVNNELPAVMPTMADTIPLNGTNAWIDPTP